MDSEKPMRFFVEETSFELAGIADLDSLEAKLEALSLLIESCHRKETDVFRWSMLLEVEIFQNLPLYRLLYEPLLNLAIDPDVRMALSAALNRCVQWDELIEPVPDPAVKINDILCWSPSAAVVRSLVASGRGAACVCLSVRADRCGPLLVKAGDAESEVHFVSHAGMLPAFYRSLFELEDLDPDAYMENAMHAFPDVVFASGLASQFQSFSAAYRDIRPKVTAHLVALNDHFKRMYKEHNFQPHAMEAALRSLHLGIAGVSMEGPNVRKNKMLMKKHEVIIAGVAVRCEWHTKIEDHQDRIYFHPGDAAVAGGRLIVGIFRKHL